MSQNQQTPASQKPQSDDPLASLHRMSTTAGVASQDYVAINLPSVAALLLGLASATVLMSNILLVLPILAIAVGIVALRQIGNSNGTQTGRAMALLGMVAALAVMGYIGVREYANYSAVRVERGQISVVVDDFSKTLIAKDYTRTATFFTPNFFTKKQIDQQGFENRWQRIVGSGLYGDLQRVDTNGNVILGGESESGRIAETMLVFTFSKAPTPLRCSAVFKKAETGEWKFDDLPTLFEAPRPERSGPNIPAPTDVMPR